MQDTTEPVWNPEPEDQTIEFGDVFSYAFDASGISYYWINNSIIFNIDPNGLINSTDLLPIGEYWIEIRAYDNQNNYCSCIIKISVQETGDGRPPGIPGYELSFLLMLLGLLIVIILAYRKKAILKHITP